MKSEPFLEVYKRPLHFCPSATLTISCIFSNKSLQSAHIIVSVSLHSRDHLSLGSKMLAVFQGTISSSFFSLLNI
jgi:hypothetical protein